MRIMSSQIVQIINLQAVTKGEFCAARGRRSTLSTGAVRASSLRFRQLAVTGEILNNCDNTGRWPARTM